MITGTATDIYSDFFLFEDAFDMSKSFFRDLDAIVVAISFDEMHNAIVDFIQGETELGSIKINSGCADNNAIITQISTQLKKLNIKLKILPERIFEIYRDVKSLIMLDERKLVNYLNSNSEVDEYIL